MKYEEVIQDIKVKIIQGYWKVDDKLPSLRQLARKYETSSNTIAFAFRILRDEGYIFSIPAVGYFIKKRKDFQISKQVKTILKSYYDAENKNDNLINFTSINLLSKYINNNFISYLFETQKKNFNKNPSHYSVINILEKLVNIRGVHLLDDGWDFKDFENILSLEKIDLVYVTPNFHDPSGICWSEDKKMYLLELAEKFDFYIIEEDNYSSLSYSQKYLSFKSFERIGKERIFYIRDFSTLLGSFLGLTCVIVPPKLKDKFLMEKIAFSIIPSQVQQNMLETFINNGYFFFFLNKLKNVLNNRLNYLVNELKNIAELKIMHQPEGGFFIWLKLNRQIDEDIFYELCKNNGLLILPGYIFYEDSRNNAKFRISFASTSLYEIEIGIKKIKKIISYLKEIN
ncbi:PLP-dependent aminotransferase family protein [Fusobacterium nucleatum]|uniref:PLP-dependent aminotransferase family protein n=1 Tax=Fusobacterium nucleatum TaxID=851 RepID=UPI0030D0C104